MSPRRIRRAEVRVLKLGSVASRLDELASGRFRPWVWRCIRPACVVFGLDHHNAVWQDAYDAAHQHARIHELDTTGWLDAHRTRTNVRAPHPGLYGITAPEDLGGTR